LKHGGKEEAEENIECRKVVKSLRGLLLTPEWPEE
jgi:hypothetical protein